MPSGFPTQPYRGELGPVPEDRHPVRNPKHEVGAELGEFLFHQVVGSGLLSDRVELEVELTTGGAALVSRREAWNANGETSGDYAPPGLVRTGTGALTVTYPASVPDQTGTARPLVIRGGRGQVVLPIDSDVYDVKVRPTDPKGPSVTVLVKKFSGGAWVAADATVLLVLR